MPTDPIEIRDNMTYTEALARAQRLADYSNSNYVVCAALLVKSGYYAESVETAPPDQVVIYVSPRRKDNEKCTTSPTNAERLGTAMGGRLSPERR